MKSFREFITEAIANIDTPKFKQWFSDSKVVYSTGAPMIVYHDMKDDSGAIKTPALFSSVRIAADNVLATYLSIQNPFHTNNWDITVKHTTNPDWVSTMKTKGYDGVIFVDDKETKCIAFDPEQIKSIYNNGNFCIDNPVINENM